LGRTCEENSQKLFFNTNIKYSFDELLSLSARQHYDNSRKRKSSFIFFWTSMFIHNFI